MEMDMTMSMYDDEARDAAMDLPGTSNPNAGGSGTGSPVDGSGSASGGEDTFGGGGMGGGLGSGGMGGMGGMGGSMGILGKPLPTNNFVTKLYQ